MKRVLVAPLNWGLGHATRCIPIIRHLLARKHSVYLASDGRGGKLLHKEFPSLPYFELPSYYVKQHIDANMFDWLRQLPALQNAIRAEHEATKALHQQLHFDAIISDNRYGVYHERVPSAIITHQLRIPHHLIAKVSGAVLQKMINRFDVCWIPDYAPPASLTKELSAHSLGIERKFIGMLSRFCHRDEPIRYAALAIMSGPEPSRTRFEEVVLKQLHGLTGEKILIQGLSNRPPISHQDRNVTVHSFALTEDLEKMMAQSEFVISRAGYTTIMDLKAMGKPAILVPTPGQPEQMYLADRLAEHPQFLIQKSSPLDFIAARRKFSKWAISVEDLVMPWQKDTVDQFLA